MKLRHWFLPDDADVLGLLRRQLEITLEGLDAFAVWADGDANFGGRVRNAEDRADAAKRELLGAVRSAFVTPIDPEDVFAMSRGIDWVLNHAADVVTEAEVMHATPDAGIARMAILLVEATRLVDEAIGHLEAGEYDAATAAADKAIQAERSLERAYYDGMAGLLEVTDMRERISRREMYRRCAQIGETLVDVAERVIYAVVKES